MASPTSNIPELKASSNAVLFKVAGLLPSPVLVWADTPERAIDRLYTIHYKSSNSSPGNKNKMKATRCETHFVLETWDNTELGYFSSMPNAEDIRNALLELKQTGRGYTLVCKSTANVPYSEQRLDWNPPCEGVLGQSDWQIDSWLRTIAE